MNARLLKVYRRGHRTRAVPFLQPLEDRTLLSPGAFDPTFDGDGKQTVPFDLGGDGYDFAAAIAVAPDGKIVLAGNAEVAADNSDFAVARLNADGTPDMTFGDGRSTFGFSITDGATGVTVQPDGKIVVAGYTDVLGSPDFVVARIKDNGFFDTDFGTGGYHILPFDLGGSKYDVAHSVALQTDGKIVVAGVVQIDGANYDFAVARLNTDGTLDSSFGVGGKRIFGSSGVDEASGVAVQPDGKIVMAGTIDAAGTSDFLVARLNSNGLLDTGFGTGGFRTIAFDLSGGEYDAASAVALQPDGKIVVAGVAEVTDGNGDFALARLNANGTLDTSFGDGRSTFGFGTDDGATGVAVQPDGKIVVTGYTNVLGSYDFVVARIKYNGFFDGAFGTGGYHIIPFDLGGNKFDMAAGVALQPDGKIVVGGGTTGFSGASDFAVARLEGQNVHFTAAGGAPNRVRVFSRAGSSLGTFSPFAGYNDAVAVAFGDVNSDGIDDLITSATIGNPAVKVYSGATLSDGTFFNNPESHVLASGFAYGINFNVGANIAAGDVNGDGFADIITGAVPGNPHVKVFDGAKILTSGVIPSDNHPSLLAQGFAYGLGFNVGANVGAGDVNGDGLVDVITGASAGNPHTRVFDAKTIVAGKIIPTNNTSAVLAEFFPYGLGFNVGSFVAAGDYNRDGFVDVVTGASVGNPEVRVFSGKDMANGSFNLNKSLLDFFFAFEQGQNIGVSVGASDFTGDGKADVVVGTRSGAPRLRVFQSNLSGSATLLTGFDVTLAGFSGPVSVSA